MRLGSPVEEFLFQENNAKENIVQMSAKARLNVVAPALSSCMVIITAIEYHF
jgi:hypothetical protein